MTGLTYLMTPLGRLRIEDEGLFITRIHFENDDEPRQQECATELTSIASQQLQAYFEGSKKVFELPFQQKGSIFQQRVWGHLLDIPCGRTISYLQLARQLRDVKCIRAAARANGKNELAIVVPCHRVIGSNGKLVGYAGGLWRKQWLLEHEATMTGKLVQAKLL